MPAIRQQLGDGWADWFEDLYRLRRLNALSLVACLVWHLAR